jgi:hypothetical protein
VPFQLKLNVFIFFSRTELVIQNFPIVVYIVLHGTRDAGYFYKTFDDISSMVADLQKYCT